MDACIPCGSRSAIGPLEYAGSRKSRGQLGRPIRRSVVDYDDFAHFDCLGQHAPDRIADESLCIVGGNHSTHQWFAPIDVHFQSPVINEFLRLNLWFNVRLTILITAKTKTSNLRLAE